MIQHRPDPPRFDDFTPVPRRACSGGWSVGRQRGFIVALAATGSVTQAAAVVKMSKTGAYVLRSARGAEDFARAWDDAVEHGVSALKSIAFERAVDGVEEPVWHDGLQVGTRRRYDNQLLASLLRLYANPVTQARFPAPVEAEPLLPRADLLERFKFLTRQLAPQPPAPPTRDDDSAEVATFDAVARAENHDPTPVQPLLRML